MKQVKTIGTYYDEGEFDVTQRHKKGEKPHYNKNGAYVTPLGYGNATEIRGSKYYLYVEMENDDRISVRIDPYFKKRNKRLTEKRRDALESCRPEYVHLESGSEDGYVMIVDEDMDDWCKNAGIK